MALRAYGACPMPDRIDPVSGLAPHLAVAGDCSDAELEALLHEVFVGGGFTPPELASTLLAAAAVRARGTLITARDATSQTLRGMIILVPPGAAARQIAREQEAELHLLAVRSGARGIGLGRALVEALLAEASERGHEKIVLSTRETMHAAHAVYRSAGFERSNDRDWVHGGREFWVFQRSLR